MGKVIQVRLGEYRPVYSFDLNQVDCNRDDQVILEMERGMEFGKVVSDVNAVCKGKAENAEGRIIRKVTAGDLNQIENNSMKAKDALNTCLRKISERTLDMQLVKAEYSFDCSKITFFFTAEGRVDFRNLVKDLAKVFRVRIDLKQIGVRDKAKIIEGYGVCGRELCCSSYMINFHPLSIRMAKEQNLPLNPSRIAGVCGRIKCCMAYEFQTYKELAKGLPRAGDKIVSPEGKGRVLDINILKHYAVVDFGEGKVSKISYPKG